MPKSNQLPTDPRFPFWRAYVEAEYGAPLPDDFFFAGVGPKWEHEPYSTEAALSFRQFCAGWNAALSSRESQAE